MRSKRKKSIIWRLLLIGVSIYMVVTLAGLCATLNTSRATLSTLKQQKALKQVEIDDLRKILDSGSRDRLIEKAARERLGYVYTDEEIYVDISGK